MALVVDRKQEVAPRRKADARNVFAVRERKGVRFVARPHRQPASDMSERLVFVFLLDQVKDCDPVAHGREQAGSVGREEQVALAVDGAEKIGELNFA